MKVGYALVEMQRDRDSGIGIDNVSFRVEMLVADGQNEFPIPQELVDIWNEEMAVELEREAKKDPDSTLVAVNLSERHSPWSGTSRPRNPRAENPLPELADIHSPGDGECPQVQCDESAVPPNAAATSALTFHGCSSRSHQV